MTEEERRDKLALQMQRIEKTLRLDHARLDAECRRLNSTWATMQQYSRTKLDVMLTVGDDAKGVPPRLPAYLPAKEQPGWHGAIFKTLRQAWGKRRVMHNRFLTPWANGFWSDPFYPRTIRICGK